MPRWSMLFIVMVVLASMIVFDPDVTAQAYDIWDALQHVLTDIQEGLAVLFDEITNAAPDVPSQNIPPIDDGHIYNAGIDKFPA